MAEAVGQIGAGLVFRLDNVEVHPHAAAPTLNFHLRVCAPHGVPISSIMLQSQLRIEAARRYYSEREKERLSDLFGAQSSSFQPSALFWTQVGVTVPAFETECAVILPVEVSYDFTLAVTKFFYGVEQGAIPLLLLLSGSVVYRNETGALQFDPIPWSREADYRLPLTVWQELTAHYYRNEVWLGLSREMFDRLYRYKRHWALPSWDSALERLLAAEEDMQARDPTPGTRDESEIR